MIHIVFEQANVAVLQKSFELDETLLGEIIEIKDDYAVGPLQNIFREEGIQMRRDWWRDILKGGHYDGIADDGHVDDNKTVSDIKNLLNDEPEEVLWIWAAQNKHDVSSYYWLISQLKDYQGRIYMLYLNNLPFINEKGNIFYPTNLYQIQPKEFIKAKKLARQITPSEFEIDPDEWMKICNENNGVRLLEGGKKLSVRSLNFYDTDLLKFVTKDWQKMHKVFNQYYSKVKETTGDAFLLWRIKVLAEEGKIVIQGNTRSMKEFEIKLPGEVLNVIDDTEPANTNI